MLSNKMAQMQNYKMIYIQKKCQQAFLHAQEFYFDYFVSPGASFLFRRVLISRNFLLFAVLGK